MHVQFQNPLLARRDRVQGPQFSLRRRVPFVNHVPSIAAALYNRKILPSVVRFVEMCSGKYLAQLEGPR